MSDQLSIANISSSPNLETTPAVLIDLGKKSKKLAKKIKKGKGPAGKKIAKALSYVAATGGNGVENKTLVPVVLVYGTKDKKKKKDKKATALTWW